MRAVWLLAFAPAALSCSGTTGYELVNFYAAARGPSDAVQGQPLSFVLDGQQNVTLTKATLHVGALYLTQSVPTSGGGPAPCVLPGTYAGVFVGEVRGGGDVDLLDPTPRFLSVTGQGSTIPAATGQVWLTHGDVNAAGDPLPILTLQGRFDLDGTPTTFSAEITIDASGAPASAPSGSTLLPGEVQICKQRIVSGIPVDVTLAQAGTLVLAVDPRALLENAKLALLPQPPGCATDRCFTSDSTNQPSANLVANLKSVGPYRFEWRPAP
jgi:hypothetical protein